MKDVIDKEGRSIKILGRTGIVYEDRTGKYLIDSEMAGTKDCDIIIFKNSVRYFDEKKDKVSFDKQEEVMIYAINLFKSAGIRFEII